MEMQASPMRIEHMFILQATADIRSLLNMREVIRGKFQNKVTYLNQENHQASLKGHVGNEALPETLGGLPTQQDWISDFVAVQEGQLYFP